MNGYQRDMLYELARELISAKIGNLSSEIGELENSSGKQRQVRELERQIVSLAHEREMLVPEETHAVRALIHRYSAKPVAGIIKELLDGCGMDELNP